MSAHHAYGGDCPGMAGRYHYGGGGLGILGSMLAAEGYIAPSISRPADDDKEYYAVLGALPAGLTLDDGEAGDFDASGADNTYAVPMDLYEYGAKLEPSVSLSFKFGTASTINLAISNLSSAGTLSTVAATVTPAPAPGVVNLAISNLASVGTLSTVVATVTPAAEPSPVTSLDVIPLNRMRLMPAQNRMARF